MRRVWAVGAPTVVAVNYLCHRTHTPTLCATWRPILRTHTRAGRVMSLTAYAVFTAWFLPHFLNTTTTTGGLTNGAPPDA